MSSCSTRDAWVLQCLLCLRHLSRVLSALEQVLRLLRPGGELEGGGGAGGVRQHGHGQLLPEHEDAAVRQVQQVA